MIKLHFKQAWQLMKSSPLVSCLSIVGTALSIAMIMVVVLTYQVKLVGFSPENKRNRMMYVLGAQAKAGENRRNNGLMSAKVVKECFYTMQNVEQVTAIVSDSYPISLPGKRLYKEYGVKYTDTGYWKIFDFQFLEGNPFTEADFNSGIRNVVINDRLARDLYGTTSAIGKTLVLDFVHYTVCGVVKEVTKLARQASADVWIPYTTNEGLMSDNSNEGISGGFVVSLLAKKRADFALIRAELEKNTDKFNQGTTDFKLSFFHNPITRVDVMMGSNGMHTHVNTLEFLSQTGALILFLLLVPALNLIGITHSSIQRRKSEVGVRKAFGATRHKLLKQVLAENLLTTLIGGVIGIFLSFLLLSVCKNFLLGRDLKLTFDMLFQPVTFIIAFFFVLLLNLLSAGIPAFRITSQSIVDAIKGNE